MSQAISHRFEFMAKRERAVEIGLLLAVVIFAAALRFWHLSAIPTGFHGDEAVSGLEAQRIWRENGIGPYTQAALGEPTGPIYAVALSIRAFGDTIFAVRLVSVIAGILTILVLYSLTRRFFDAKIALLAAFLLSCTNWHLHFSRVGFPLATWPLFVLIGVWVLLEATTRRHVFWWALSGVVLCSGIYIYNAHTLFLAIACAFAIWCLWRDKTVTRRRRILFFIVFFGALILVALPMVFYALKPDHYFASHFELYSLFRREEWLQSSYGMRFGILLGRYLDFWERLCWHPRVDAADGTGIVPQMPLMLVLLAFFGAFRLWKTRRDNAVILLVLLLLLLPVGSVITIDGAMRRTFALAPVLALFSALGMAQFYRTIVVYKPHYAPLMRVTLATFLLFISGQTARDYFVTTVQTDSHSWAFVRGITEASLWMKSLPQGTHVYFMSERWSEQYQTRQFLAPDVWIEDRSKQHGIFSLDDDDRDTDSVWLLLDNYQIYLSEIRILHPGGEVIEGPPLPGTDKKCFIVYRRQKKTSHP